MINVPRNRSKEKSDHPKFEVKFQTNEMVFAASIAPAC